MNLQFLVNSYSLCYIYISSCYYEYDFDLFDYIRIDFILFAYVHNYIVLSLL